MVAWDCLNPKTHTRNIERNQYLHKDCRLPQHRCPWVKVLYTDGCQVRLLDGLTRQTNLITDNVQHALGKEQIVAITFWSVSKLKCLLGEAGCSHQDSAKGYQHSRWCFDQGRKWDYPWHSSPKFPWDSLKQKPKVQCWQNTIQDEIIQVLWAAINPRGMGINLKKVNAIKQMAATKCKNELEHFQGMVNYLKCYSSQLLEVIEPLKDLLGNDTL